MAASVQDHFHLLESATPGNETTANEWRGMAPDMRPRVLPLFSIAGAPRRSLNGKLRAYVLQDGDGPIVFKDWAVLVKCADWSEVETWAGYIGDYRYFVYNYHDPVLHNSYTQRVWVDFVEEPQVTGPLYSHIMLNVHLTDASQ